MINQVPVDFEVIVVEMLFMDRNETLSYILSFNSIITIIWDFFYDFFTMLLMIIMRVGDEC